MNAGSMCVSCILSKEELAIRQFADEERKSEYMHQVLGILYKYAQEESSPGLTERLERLYEEFWGTARDFREQKHKYNQLLLNMEPKVEQQIKNAADPLMMCIQYVCAANYIDFSAVADVNEEKLAELLSKAVSQNISREEYLKFCEDLQLAGKLVYLTDNCGEIVLDKIFIRHMQENFPNLQITAIVRGGDVINDATMEDADEVGLTKIVPCVGNGNAAPGTIIKRLSKQVKDILCDADVIISKGQGNFESLYGENLNPYYLFLCKCELFVRRFHMKQYQSMFVREERLEIACGISSEQFPER